MCMLVHVWIQAAKLCNIRSDYCKGRTHEDFLACMQTVYVTPETGTGTESWKRSSGENAELNTMSYACYLTLAFHIQALRPVVAQ